MKIALVHDWLIVPGGAEKVLREILHLLEGLEIDIYCLADFMNHSDRNYFLGGRTTTTSFIQHLPGAEKHYRYYLPLFPAAIRRFDLSNYDLVISSSHSIAKGVNTGFVPHICYCHTPMRYIWDMKEQYMQQHHLNKGWKKRLAGLFFSRLRKWDRKTSEDVSWFLANSHFVKNRIHANYARESNVIYPPVDTDFYSLHTEKENYYVTASRMVPYKRMELIVQAFAQMPSQKLVVIGDGPEFGKIKALKTHNIEIVRYHSRETLRHYLQRAKAFVFAATEDFGITPVEAQACGTPVIAFGLGGATETILEGKTGLFFHDQTVRSIIDTVQTFEQRKYPFNPLLCRENALRFDKQRFSVEFYDFLHQKFFKYCYEPQIVSKVGQ